MKSLEQSRSQKQLPEDLTIWLCVVECIFLCIDLLNPISSPQITTARFFTELPTKDAACRSSRNVNDKLDIGSVPIGEEFPGIPQIFQSRRTLTTTCLTSLWTPTLGRCYYVIGLRYDDMPYKRHEKKKREQMTRRLTKKKSLIG
ncbi:hypothetical protein G5I_02999 [Acromyrmex echinatior]|uniref:Uncharacterized protein n=1 Tax=Acromyrmex echinatior TaxID=103372 RepID=F4WBS8_ACREC|nr:hypothetical protein G5I_02999 [Acromyrmex echinatior]